MNLYIQKMIIDGFYKNFKINITFMFLFYFTF